MVGILDTIILQMQKNEVLDENYDSEESHKERDHFRTSVEKGIPPKDVEDECPILDESSESSIATN